LFLGVNIVLKPSKMFNFVFCLVTFFVTLALASDEGVCHSCIIGIKELVKAVPILRKATASVREGDKELALADAMPSFCSSSNFHGFSQDLVTDCKTFLTTSNVDGALEKTLISGEIDEKKVCESVCAFLPEDKREPARVESQQKSTGNKATKNAKTGTVNDPAYKEALKKKEARDKKRMASAAAEAEDVKAASDAAAASQSEDAKKVKKEKRKVKQTKEERVGEEPVEL
jgi:hypothetical protein